MAQAILNFPRNFMWGTVSSSHQVEGNNYNNNWYAWEKSDQFEHRQTSNLGCDWWGGRWREDFDRASEAGQNTHRLSVEWSRIQPNANRWDEDSLDHYRQMVRGLLERGMKPMVTLHHFSEPLWVSELGGWQNQAVLDHFARYVRKTVEALHEYVTWWCTINGPNVAGMRAFLIGDYPPGKKSLSAFYKGLTNMIKGHALAYQIIHEVQPQAKVGVGHNYRSLVAAKSYSPFDHWFVNTLSQVFNDSIPRTLAFGTFQFLGIQKRMSFAKGTQDFFGLNYYSRDSVSFGFQGPGILFSKREYSSNVDLSPSGFIANDPEGFFQALKWAKAFKLPVFVTENGTEDPQDGFRRRYIAEHIHALWRAVNFSWKIQGYYHRSLVDSFEWDHSWSQQYGLWELKINTQERQKRVSADLYRAICQENALSSEIVDRYTPEVSNKLFPN